MYKIGYEETDKKEIVNIYGLEFELKKIDEKLLEEFKAIKSDEMENFEELYKFVDLFLGEGASEKINEKRKQDGYDKMTYANILAIIELVFKVREDEVKKYSDKYHNYNKRINNYKYNKGRRY